MSSISSVSRAAKNSTRTSIAFSPFLPFLYPVLQDKGSAIQYRAPASRRLCRRPSSTPLRTDQQRMHNVFISALVRAGSCREDGKPKSTVRTTTRTLSSHTRSRRRTPSPEDKTTSRGYKTGGHNRSSAAAAAVAPAEHEISREELEGIADLYPMFDHWEAQDQSASIPTPESPPLLPPPPPEPPDTDFSDIASRKHRPIVNELRQLLKQGPNPKNHAAIFEIYQSLPFPRVSYLPPEVVRWLLACFTLVPRHNDASSMRFLSIMDDMKVANVPATVSEWNTTISLAAQTFRKVTNAEIESAMYVWKDMEQRAGVQASEVTFNILFNMASKAGKFPLVELILKEMEVRSLDKTRAFRCGAIFHAGQLRDGDAVRRAYKEYVASGEVVDSVVLNNVIRSLYKAGEYAAAETIFERMKVMHRSPTNRDSPENEYFRRRKKKKELQFFAALYRNDTESRREVQERAPLKPDTHTYDLMIEHAAREAGNYHRSMRLLDEMHIEQVPRTRDVFRQLFTGFNFHGKRPRSTEWSPGRLWRVWLKYKAEQKRDPEEFELDGRTAWYLLQAMWSCGGPVNALRLWEDEIRDAWKGASAETRDAEDVQWEQKLNQVLRALPRGRS